MSGAQQLRPRLPRCLFCACRSRLYVPPANESLGRQALSRKIAFRFFVAFVGFSIWDRRCNYLRINNLRMMGRKGLLFPGGFRYCIVWAGGTTFMVRVPPTGSSLAR